MSGQSRWTAVLVVALAAAFSLPQGWGAGSVRAEPPEKKEKKDKGEKPSKKKPKKKAKPVRGFTVGPREESHFEIEAGAEGNEVSFHSGIKSHPFDGKSTQVTGTIDANPHLLHSAKGKFSVAWSTVDTGNPQRNQHMMSKPWVDAGAHPEIVFTLEGIEKLKKADKRGLKLKGTLVGAFSINGAEKKMKIPATLEYVEAGKDDSKSDEMASGAPDDGPAAGGKEGIRIEAKFNLGLKDFGIEGMGVGKKVAAKQAISVSLFLPIKAAEKKEPEPRPEAPTGRPRVRPKNR